uniref:Thioredoxin domain-containing protein n=1 Tax=Pinguiococcus pyrenoidosus TaxID=172671 RepID=A0A7R9U532_9STRA|mmetsp:Transcript_15186/g.57754  ORF Transcript_15186/g.57754 Transcript_15186/m.57754 type:complete len:197 (+) Transcript_15186:75-665(+)
MMLIRGMTLLAFASRVAGFAPRAGARLGRAPLRMISVGDSVPMDGEFMTLGSGGPGPLKYDEVFKGKKVVVVGVPGALTPTCSEKHVPGFLSKQDEFKAKGVDSIAVLSVNDPFVMGVWKEKLGAGDDVAMLADGGAQFVSAADIGFDTGGFGGTRCTRMSMLVNDGKVEQVFMEEGGGYTESGEGSNADHMLAQL